MSCWKPRKVARLFAVNKKGNRIIKWSIPDNLSPNCYECIFVPCGQCGGCRTEYSRQWAIRMVHESKLYRDNCFLTLTFDDEHLFKRENPYSLCKKDFQDFMKRFRDRLDYPLLRYFYAGEYGEKKGRPHYHACIFNYDFKDKVYHKSRRGNKLYTSEFLSDLWPYGYCSVGSLTFESAAYVARYCTKKFSNKNKDKIRAHYEYVDSDGKVWDCIPEFADMSRNGGIGKEFFKLYGRGWYPQDELIIREGIGCKPPKYYDGLYEVDHPESMAIIKRRRADVNKNVDTSDYVRNCEAMAANMKAKFALFCKRELE